MELFALVFGVWYEIDGMESQDSAKGIVHIVVGTAIRSRRLQKSNETG